MSKVKLAALATFAAIVLIASSFVTEDEAPSAVAEALGVKHAQADRSDIRKTRRVVRRTVRRIERRQDRREALDDDCVAVIIGGIGYWNCSGIYYQGIVEDGVTVYVIVNP